MHELLNQSYQEVVFLNKNIKGNNPPINVEGGSFYTEGLPVTVALPENFAVQQHHLNITSGNVIYSDGHHRTKPRKIRYSIYKEVKEK